MSNIYLYKNYLIKKLTRVELKLSDLDESYRFICDTIDDNSNKMNEYSKLITNTKYSKLMKKINLYQIELYLVSEVITDLESMYEYKELMEEQMLV